jgi:hypothetical protein
VGLAVAGIVLTAATQLLLHGFETDPMLSAGTVDSLADWIERRPREGAALLGGIALCLLGVALSWLAWTSRVDHQIAITTRRANGWTKVDRKTLAEALARRLEDIDRRSDVRLTVNRQGRVDLRVVTPDPSISGPIPKYRDAIDQEAGARHLPVRAGRVTTTRPRTMTGRRRVL